MARFRPLAQVPGPDDPLRIAWLVYRGNPHCGGQGVYTRYVAREVAARGHEISVFSGQPRSTQRLSPAPVPDAEQLLRARLRDLAAEHPRYGYRRLGVLLAREGYRVNHKRVQRLCREEGLRFHHPEKHRKDSAPSLTAAVWPPVITRAEHERLVAQLSDPRRRTNGATRPGAVVHWLSGVAVCGECGKPMRVLTNRGKYRSYTCVRPGCMKVSRTAGPVEEYVQAVLFALLDNPLVLSAVSGRSSDDAVVAAMDQVDALTARRDSVRVEVTSGRLSAVDGAVILTALGDEITAAEEQLRAVSLPRRAADLDLSGLRERWAGMSPARKRAVADALVSVEVLSMHGRKARVFDPATVRVQPRWA